VGRLVAMDAGGRSIGETTLPLAEETAWARSRARIVANRWLMWLPDGAFTDGETLGDLAVRKS
jgi:hypothetical protein